VGGWKKEAGCSENGRISVFDLDGMHGRTKSLRGEPSSFVRELVASSGREPEGGGSGLVVHVAVDVLPDGTLLTRDTGTYGGWRSGLPLKLR